MYYIVCRFEFPEVVDMTPYFEEKQFKSYVLKTVLIHQGTISLGHNFIYTLINGKVMK